MHGEYAAGTAVEREMMARVLQYHHTSWQAHETLGTLAWTTGLFTVQKKLAGKSWAQ